MKMIPKQGYTYKNTTNILFGYGTKSVLMGWLFGGGK
jgi:hypothetical protein